MADFVGRCRGNRAPRGALGRRVRVLAARVDTRAEFRPIGPSARFCGSSASSWRLTGIRSRRLRCPSDGPMGNHTASAGLD